MPHPRSRQGSQAISPLFVIKLMHTVIWAFFAGCIVALPVAGLMRRFDWALIFAAIVLVECAVLVVNRWRCPLTGIAARYTSNRADNFDIFLPAWRGTTRRSSVHSFSSVEWSRSGIGSPDPAPRVPPPCIFHLRPCAASPAPIRVRSPAGAAIPRKSAENRLPVRVGIPLTPDFGSIDPLPRPVYSRSARCGAGNSGEPMKSGER
jgi:hypothetical protein